MLDRADLDLSRSGPDLIDAIWRARREQRRDLRDQIGRLLQHENPIVREEALSLLMSNWRDHSIRPEALRVLEDDDDFGVRSRVAIGIAGITSIETADDDLAILRTLVLNPREHQQVRRAAYEALCIIAGKDIPPLNEQFRIEKDADLNWVRSLTGGV